MIVDVAPIPLIPVSSACVVSAANTYRIHPAELLTVMSVEGGKIGEVSKNKNGTVDIGPMQINSIHLGMLSRYNISFERLKNDGCLNVHIGAYFIKKAKESNAKKNYWQNLAVYHSRTEEHNLRYAQALSKNLNKLPPEWKNFSCEQYNVCGLSISQANQGVLAQQSAYVYSNQSVAYQALEPYRR